MPAGATSEKRPDARVGRSGTEAPVKRRVLVTGASSGIGLATVLHLSALGFETLGLVQSDQDAAALAGAADGAGVAVTPVVLDLADGERRAKLDLELYGLINNAGFMNAGLTADVPLAEARRQLEVMVLAPIDLARRALPFMLERGEGRILNVTSSAVHATTPFTAWYQAAKAALRELTDSLRVELAATGIDVVDIEPGGVSTGIWQRASEELQRHRARSRRADLYERPLRIIERFQHSLADPERVAVAIGTVLTRGRPRNHVRVGADAGPLRVLSDVVPDKVADRVVGRVSGVR